MLTAECRRLPLYYHPNVTSRLSRWLRDPLFLLCLTAGLLAFVVQSGELGTADTMHRLQTTHWLWTSEPQVFPSEYPEFGLHGRGGQLYSWYGIGQSLLMLPADLLATWISHWHIFARYTDDPAVRSIVVAYSTGILINVLTAWITFRLLRQLQFSLRESVAGEPDGEQLHHAADAGGILVSVRVAAHGKRTRAVDWIGGAWAESVDAADYRFGLDWCGIVFAGRVVV
jgi:hypothetical protein